MSTESHENYSSDDFSDNSEESESEMDTQQQQGTSGARKIVSQRRVDKQAKKRSHTSIHGEQNSSLNKDVKSRLSAKECRARKKLRYQYLEELIDASENLVFKLRDELKQLENKCIQIDQQNGFPPN